MRFGVILIAALFAGPLWAGECGEIFTDHLEMARQLREELRGRAREVGVDRLPLFLRSTPQGDIPVVLVNSDTENHLSRTFDQSIGMLVELENRGENFDHGAVRVGQRLLDYYAPGTRYTVGDPHTTGILSRNVSVVLQRREAQFKNRSSDANPDGTPFRYIEMLYPVTPEEKLVADLYYRGRQSGLWRAEYFFKKGKQDDKPNLLCRADSAEHCLAFTAGSLHQNHMGEIEDNLYNKLGIKEWIPSWLQKPEVMEFQKQARQKFLEAPFGDNNPENWKKMDHNFLANSDLFRVIAPVVPANLSAAQKSSLMNYVLAHRLIKDYGGLMKRLGITEHNYLDWDNPKAGAVMIWDGSEFKDRFINADYTFKGTIYSFPQDNKNRPLAKP